MPEFLHKNIRLPAERYLGQQLYFVTLCFHHRRRLGANPRIARWLINELRNYGGRLRILRSRLLRHARSCARPHDRRLGN